MNITPRLFTNLLAVAFVGVFFAGCGDSKKEKSNAEGVKFSDAEQKIVTDMDKVIHDLPSPTEVPYMLQATAADFNGDLINSLENLPKYQTNEDEAALNLGVYATDMGYLISYKQINDATDYMEACQKLAESLGVASVFNVSTVERFQNNLNNPDTLNKILSEAIVEAEGRLENADRASMAALVLTGSFVEGLYLAVKVIETYPKDVLDEANRNLILEPLLRVVLEQEKPLIDVIAMLKDIPQDDIIATMIVEMNILRRLYDTDLAEIQEKITSNQGNFVLTQDMLIDVIKEVERIRTDIVEFKF